MRERELKLIEDRRGAIILVSLPMRERELKLPGLIERLKTLRVAPHAGA